RHRRRRHVPAVGVDVPQVQHQGRGDHGWVCDLFELWVLEVRVGFLPRHPFLRSFELKVYRASEQLRSINQEIDAWLKAEPMKTKWVPREGLNNSPRLGDNSATQRG